MNDWENYNSFYTEQRLGKPQENPEAYRRSSPIRLLTTASTPASTTWAMWWGSSTVQVETWENKQIAVEAGWDEIGAIAQRLIDRDFTGKAVLHIG